MDSVQAVVGLRCQESLSSLRERGGVQIRLERTCPGPYMRRKDFIFHVQDVGGCSLGGTNLNPEYN